MKPYSNTPDTLVSNDKLEIEIGFFIRSPHRQSQTGSDFLGRVWSQAPSTHPGGMIDVDAGRLVDHASIDTWAKNLGKSL